MTHYCIVLLVFIGIVNISQQIAKNPSKRPGDWLTLKNRAYDDSIRSLQAQVKEQKKQDLRTDFESSTEKKILHGNIKMKVQAMTHATEYNLECRRQK